MIKRYLSRVEELGCFESIWDQEQILGAQPNLEPLHLLTFAAACTTRVRLGCMVVLTALRSPVHLAKEMATLDLLSAGRLVMGVGLGQSTANYPAFGADPSTRVARFVEGIRIMKGLWTEPRFSFAGRFWRLEDAAMEPKPRQKPHPPIYFGGNHPNALRRAVELGDGFIGAGSQSPDEFASQAQMVRSELELTGHDPSKFEIGKRVYIAVDNDRERAGAGLAKWFAGRYGRPEAYKRVCVWGPPADCAAGLQGFVDSGAQTLLLTPLFDEPEQMERLATEVLPLLS